MREHELIREIRRLLRADGAGAGPGVVVGPGDDCAVLAAPGAGRELVFTTDAANEGVHFDLAWMSAAAVGARAMVANLSDVAAMAARPRWATLAVGVPAGERGAPDTVLGIVKGAAQAAAAHGAAVVGGNLARSPGGLTIAIALVGEVEAGRAVLRSGGQDGDELWVTGTPGWSRAGLLALQRGRAGDADAAPFLERFRAPSPRIEEAIFLRDRAGARALIDLSDGLAGDVLHIAAESGLAAEIDAAALPVAPALAAFAARLGEDPRALVLAGGEDYELLLAAPPGRVEAVRGEFEGRFGVGLARIGRLVAGAGARLADGSPLGAAGFDHFSE